MPELAHAAEVIGETRARIRHAYGDAIGKHRRDLVTPALILDLPVARRNIQKMADMLRTMPAKIRPHIKVHKSPELARMQVDAGAIGISTATVWEAIVMVRSGLDSIFIVNTVARREKLAAIAGIARDYDVMVAVDDAENAADIAKAARAAGSTVGVLIEVDTGMDRAGVDTEGEAVELARRVDGLEGVRLLGVTGYEGHCSLTPEAKLRAERQHVAMTFLTQTAATLRAKGFPCPIVSAGGTATWNLTAADPNVTEIQAGSYAVMDNFHKPMAGDFEHAVTVATTVISRPPDRVIVDAGNKSLGAPALSTIVGHDNAGFRFDEEHGVFVAGPNEPLRVGDVVELLPGYAPGTVNWYDAYHVVEADRVVDIWPVIPRGPGHGGLIS
ncbi:MAG TPA: alanine racemase [Candidatus Limnocylindrales bacterium]|nr:alanine racemase [Candidatus Limnocylindrales bacterium]